GAIFLSPRTTVHPQSALKSVIRSSALPSFLITKSWLITSPVYTSPKSKLVNGTIALGAVRASSVLCVDLSACGVRPLAETNTAVMHSVKTSDLTRNLNRRKFFPFKAELLKLKRSSPGADRAIHL